MMLPAALCLAALCFQQARRRGRTAGKLAWEAPFVVERQQPGREMARCSVWRFQSAHGLRQADRAVGSAVIFGASQL